MQFSDKLNFLMNITQTSNKELAMGISVDRSLISLLRNGKRGIPRNHVHIQNMAFFFPNDATLIFSARHSQKCLDLRHFVPPCQQNCLRNI